MSVTAPKGFVSSGIAAGVKASGALDLALVVNEGPLPATAVVFTSNRAQANPILWSRNVHESGTARAVVLNSGGANCFTGSFGYETSALTARRLAEVLQAREQTVARPNPGEDEGWSEQEILVCSTGLIGTGDETFRNALIGGLDPLVAALSLDGDNAARAIMTTDSVPKTVIAERTGWTIGGMAKGAGMLAPGLATMLVVITTDAVLTRNELDQALRRATAVSFDRLDSDGCMSTNDQVTLMASGASGITPSMEEFSTALVEVCDSLAAQLQHDAEGASHDIDIVVRGAASEREALEVARSIARNNLFKAAIFGNDPNWGRVLAAIGTTTAAFDPYAVDVSFNGVRLCHAGAPDRPIEECDLTPRRTLVELDLFAGSAEVTVRTNDLTHDYVHENSAYSS